jgi:hypothetical protein
MIERERYIYIYLLGSKCGDFELISGGSGSVGLTCILFVKKSKKVQSGCPSAYMLSIPHW